MVAVVALWAAVWLLAGRFLADRDWAPYAVFVALWSAAVLVHGALFNRRARFALDVVVVVALAVLAAGAAAGWGWLHPLPPVLVAPG